MTLLKELLKGQPTIVSVVLAATVRDAVKAMVEANVGSVVVVDGDRLAGIFSERDLMNLVHLKNPDLDKVQVADVMTTDIVVANPDESVGNAILLMRTHHIRHLPVRDEGGKTLGVLSIRDLIREQANEMRDYIAQREG